MRIKDFYRDLIKLTKEFWVEAGLLVIAMSIVFEILRRIFIWFG
jgi:multisubunit Na+/H+ antiporter MnhG subunit